MVKKTVKKSLKKSVDIGEVIWYINGAPARAELLDDGTEDVPRGAKKVLDRIAQDVL